MLLIANTIELGQKNYFFRNFRLIIFFTKRINVSNIMMNDGFDVIYNLYNSTINESLC